MRLWPREYRQNFASNVYSQNGSLRCLPSCSEQARSRLLGSWGLPAL